MAQWLVNQREMQFGVETLQDLKQLAIDGKLRSGDLVQPPGATEWLYALEVPDLKGIVKDPDEIPGQSSGSGATMMIAAGVGIVLLGCIGVTTVTASWAWVSSRPTGNEMVVGEGGLAYSQMLTTESTNMLAEPSEGASTVATLSKDDVVELLAKRGLYYHCRNASGVEGWVKVDAVIPMYQLGNADVQADYDPLYNPDRYVSVGNASWMLAPDSQTKTVFRFMLANDSKFTMTDFKLVATVKDGTGRELDRVEFPVIGDIPPASPAGPGTTMVGTLSPEDKRHGTPELVTDFTLADRAKTDPDIQLRWTDGIEVEMKAKDFAVATIDIVEVRARPKDAP